MPANFISENFLFDSLSALALMIAFYYALSGIACVVYYRRELRKSVKNFLLIGVGPIVGAILLGYLFVEATPHAGRRRRVVHRADDPRARRRRS